MSKYGDRTSFHPLSTRIVNLLEAKNVWFKSFIHQPVRTSQEAAQVRTGYSLEQGAKALILRAKGADNSKAFVMVVLSGDSQFDRTKVAAVCKAKDIRFATEAEVRQLTNGVELGGVPPLGNIFGIPVMLDKTLLLQRTIIFNAGDRRFSVAIRLQDYVDWVCPTVVDIIRLE